MNEPTIQTEEELAEFDDKRLTEIAVVNPSIAILETRGVLKILISKDTFNDHSRTCFRGARLIHIPLGWRLAAMNAVSRFWPVRLPAEVDFYEVEIDAHASDPIATADGEFLCRVSHPALVRPLTGREYFFLMTVRGRGLHQWVREHFQIPAEGRSRTKPKRDARRVA